MDKHTWYIFGIYNIILFSCECKVSWTIERLDLSNMGNCCGNDVYIVMYS